MSKQDGSQRVGFKTLVHLSKSEQRPVSRNIGCNIAALQVPDEGLTKGQRAAN